MGLVDRLSAQIMAMIPAFELQAVPGNAVGPQGMACGVLVLANATVSGLKLAAIALPRDRQLATEEPAPPHQTLSQTLISS
ncbi:hypothetical protein [Paraburkholderia lycopersici]|nr:hypothetical protein [Paraburkholderia lycopersici]